MENSISFKNKKLFNTWLKKNHLESDGIWLRIFKKGSEEETVTYQEALEEALCYGWIDGIKKSYDYESWIQRFTPRRSKSIWSQRNRVIVQKLIDEDRMRPPGLKVVDEAKADGRWDAAYASPKDMVIPDQYLKQIKSNKRAYEHFKTLSKSKLYAIGFRLHTAKKEETKLKRLESIIKMLEAGTFA